LGVGGVERHSHPDHLWNLLMLELWHRVFIDAPMTSGAEHAVSVAAF